MKKINKVLVCLAHPDDESFGMGGTLAKYAREGAEITLVCTTRGEAGDVDPKFLEGYQSIAELRTAELTCAAKHLGIKEVIYYDYRDSGMQGSEDNKHKNAFINVPMDILVERLVKEIREKKPDIVVTFDPIGGYRHPDHIYIHQATVKAFHAAANENEYKNINLPAHLAGKLYFNTFPRKLAQLLIKIMKLFGKGATKIGRNKDINLEEIFGEADFPMHIKVNYKSFAQIKLDASNCHKSQLSEGTGGGNLLFRLLRLFKRDTDYFIQAYPEVPDNFRTNGW